MKYLATATNFLVTLLFSMTFVSEAGATIVTSDTRFTGALLEKNIGLIENNREPSERMRRARLDADFSFVSSPASSGEANDIVLPATVMQAPHFEFEEGRINEFRERRDVVPLPAALPLFIGGFGFLGLSLWGRTSSSRSIGSK